MCTQGQGITPSQPGRDSRAAPAAALRELCHLAGHVSTGGPADLATVKTTSPFSCIFKCELSADN